MRNPRVASRYAKALVSMAQERNELDLVKNDMEMLLKTLKDNRELRAVIASPVIKPDQKKGILNEIFAKNICELSLHFLNLLVDQRREHNTIEVLENFMSQYLIAKNIVKAHVTTSIEVDADIRKEFQTMLEKQSAGKEILIEEKVDPDLIGGFVVRIGDMEYDASISGKLKKLKREFEENPYASGL